jgi:hypothetical protein
MVLDWPRDRPPKKKRLGQGLFSRHYKRDEGEADGGDNKDEVQEDQGATVDRSTPEEVTFGDHKVVLKPTEAMMRLYRAVRDRYLLAGDTNVQALLARRMERGKKQCKVRP